MINKKISFKSYNNLHNINGEIFYHVDKSCHLGVVQISHGMTEHIARYEEFIEFLVESGYVVAIHDHAGHGDSVADDKIYGYMGKNGAKVLVNDLYNFTKIVRCEFPTLPYFIFGHSMGSFILRKFMSLYKEDKHKLNINGFILCGTGGNMEYIDLALILSEVLVKVKGEKSLGKLFRRLSFDSYDKELKGKEGNWLTRDMEKIEYIANDEKGRFTFTNGGYNSVLKLSKSVNTKKWYKSLDKNFKTLIISGGDDPVGYFGVGPKSVHENMLKASLVNTEIIIYPNSRHELINETNRYDVYNDIINWISKITRTN